MKLEVWRRAEDLFHAALERSPGVRAAFIEEACAGDSDLRRQVEELLSIDERTGSFLDKALPVEILSALDAGAHASLVGKQHGRYHILCLLGVGGMGQVYRAHDDKLGRDVAIKTLSPEFARDSARLARFRREARALASLNHPNIAAIYELEESTDLAYLVLELVEGETPRGPMRLAMALDYASQVAGALQAAHEHGIVHRDLKPANLRVTPQGTVKVLDFGLAKAIWQTEVRPDVPQSSKDTFGGTATGHILGTPGYMSPEQARGENVDQRTDIWSFGCVLYELLTGSKAFDRVTQEETLAAVLERDPDWHALPSSTPPPVIELLRRCLQKDASRRLNDMAEAKRSIHDVLRTSEQRSPDARNIRSLAVLPLINSTRDPEQDYFADAMTEALIAALARIRALRVISRTSVMHYRNTTKTLPEVGRELGVDGIIEGSVLRIGDRVRITAQLIHAATDQHLWARSYDRDLQDLLALQREVARAIADEIQVSVTPQERAGLSRIRLLNVDSHEAYIRGRYHWGRANPARSIEHYRQAIAIDPDNALAYAGIADAQCMMFGAAMESVPPTEIAPKARSSALKALELDDSLAEPHVTLARVLFWHDRDPVSAERELRRAIDLNPNCAMAHFHCGLLFADLKRADESVAAFRRALQLDPVSCWNSTIAGWVMYEVGQEAAGRRELQKALELDPNFFYARTAQSVLHGYEGSFEEAITEAQEGVRLSGGLPLTRAWAAYALGKGGRRDEALAILDELEKLSRERYVPAAARIWCYLGLGDLEQAVEWTEVAFRQRDSQLPHSAIYRAFRPLDADPRFQNLMRQLGIPE